MANLKNTLTGAGIDVSKWGQGNAKSLAHLEKEMFFGETVMALNREGELRRNLRICTANVFYADKDGVIYKLNQVKQVFASGRERPRRFDNSMTEKCQFEEDALKAMHRGLKEELGLEGVKSVKMVGEKKENLDSESYPGLQSVYTIYDFKVDLSDEDYNPEGYVEDENGIFTYFEWEIYEDNKKEDKS
jgi:hypothetical protein